MLNSTTSMRENITAVTSTVCSLVLLYFLTQYTGGEFFQHCESKKNRESYRQTSS